MDDETYVKMDFKQIPGQCYYASKIRGNVSDKYKYVMTDCHYILVFITHISSYFIYHSHVLLF